MRRYRLGLMMRSQMGANFYFRHQGLKTPGYKLRREAT
jgi:hypothetical protein